MRHIPDACEPVSNERESGHQEEEDGSSVLGIAIDLTGHSDQPQQPGCFQQADQRRCLSPLREDGEEEEKKNTHNQ